MGAKKHTGQSVFGGSLMPPFLVLKNSALTNNLGQMREFCERNNVELAPHCKTHMSPELWRLQEEFGASLATVANVAQAEVFFSHGVERILIANEVVERQDLSAIVRMRRERASFEISILVDSVAAVAVITAVLEEIASDLAPLQVLIEFGAPGRRAGCRTPEEVVAVAEAVDAATSLELVGLEGYEGVFGPVSAAERSQAIDGYLDSAAEIIRTLIDKRLVAQPTIATFGGSRYYPAVIDRIRNQFSSEKVSVILRSGCYLTHDHGTYARSHAEVLSTVGKPDLKPAIEVWGAVLSTPEPGLAIVGIGKRDVSYDEGMPIVLARYRDGTISAVSGMHVAKLNDQHAYLELGTADSTEFCVGDLVAFGISHPCTTFDKWRSALLVDDEYRVVDVAHTFFH